MKTICGRCKKAVDDNGDCGCCRGCNQPFRDATDEGVPMDRVADGCVCNSARGVNHGLVPDYVCTCDQCDPQQTGAVRDRPNKVKFREFL